MKNLKAQKFRGASCGKTLHFILNEGGASLVLAVRNDMDDKEAMFAPLLVASREDRYAADVVALWKIETYLEKRTYILNKVDSGIPYQDIYPEGSWLPGDIGFARYIDNVPADFIDRRDIFVRANRHAETIWLAMRYMFAVKGIDDQKEMMNYYLEHYGEWRFSIENNLYMNGIFPLMSISQIEAIVNIKSLKY
mgnify:CR=1 FL=1